MAEQSHSFDQQVQLEIPVEAPPDRIVSLVPSMTESLFELNLGARVVGRTEACVFPEGKVEGLPVVGGVKSPDIGAILDLNPDLVIVNQDENRHEDIEKLQEAAVPVWVTFPKTIADVFNMLWNVMYVCEETVMVPRVRLIEQTYDWVLAVTEANEDQICKVFASVKSEPLMTFNHDTYMHHVLVTCGATNVFTDREARYSVVSWDDVVMSQPDVILLAEGGIGRFTAEDLAKVQELDIPAAKTDSIYLIDYKLLDWPGIRLAFALEVIPPLICAENSKVDGA